MKLEWETTVANRVNGTGECPYLVNKKALKGFNDLQSLRPDLASEWNYERNGDLNQIWLFVVVQKRYGGFNTI